MPQAIFVANSSARFYPACMGKIQFDLAGRRFGKLIVLRFHGINADHSTSWLCRCDCGTEKLVRRSNLAKAKSCGCLNIPGIKAAQTTHGMSETKTYSVWRGMLKRCNSPNDKSYHTYGGRGIRVCERWHDFAAFWEDMGETYREGLSLERLDVDGPYDPTNCVWIPFADQYKNRRHPKDWIVPGRPSTSGVKGVTKSRGGRWMAMVTLPGKVTRYVGTYDTIEEASEAYKNAAIELRGWE